MPKSNSLNHVINFTVRIASNSGKKYKRIFQQVLNSSPTCWDNKFYKDSLTFSTNYWKSRNICHI
jgi:hypothetical protein